MYWVKRVQVYYNKDLEKVINTIGANYKSTINETNNTKSVPENSTEKSNDARSVGNHVNTDVDTFLITNYNSTNEFTDSTNGVLIELGK